MLARAERDFTSGWRKMVSRHIKAIENPNILKIKKIFRNRCLVNPAHFGIVVHEIHPKSHRPKTWNELDNQVLLCHECHDKIHNDGAGNWAIKLEKLRDVWMSKYG